MATMDLIKYYGGEPANFLDIGGSSNPEKVVNALRIITSDPNVKVICFNIFGGITRCDDVANGIVEATRDQHRSAARHPADGHERRRKRCSILNDAGFTPPRRWTRWCRRPLNSPGRPERERRWHIFIDQNTKLLVQGITGRDGSFHAFQMMEYGTQVVGGVTPGKGGQTSTGRTAARCPSSTPWRRPSRDGANASVIYVPPPFAADAIMEAADAGVPFIVASPKACRCWT
jgi:hypothetical protein